MCPAVLVLSQIIQCGESVIRLLVLVCSVLFIHVSAEVFQFAEYIHLGPKSLDKLKPRDTPHILTAWKEILNDLEVVTCPLIPSEFD